VGKGAKRLKVVDINPKVAQALSRLDEIIDGCKAVRELEESSKDAKQLATLVIRDCNRVIAILRGERFPGDDAG
jgi:uncharacterized protein with PhoU and TrkA domain